MNFAITIELGDLVSFGSIPLWHLFASKDGSPNQWRLYQKVGSAYAVQLGEGVPLDLSKDFLVFAVTAKTNAIHPNLLIAISNQAECLQDANFDTFSHGEETPTLWDAQGALANLLYQKLFDQQKCPVEIDGADVGFAWDVYWEEHQH